MNPRNESGLGRVADLVLLAAALPFAVVLLVAGLRFHPEVTRDQAVFLYALPIVILTGLGLVLRFRESVRINVALLLVASGVAVGIAELAAGFRLAADRAPPEDRRTLAEWVAELRDEGLDAYPRLAGNDLVRTALPSDSGPPLRPVSPAPGSVVVALCQENGRSITYPGDSLGFNNPIDAWGAESPVVLVGDSYVHGVCLEPEQGVAAKLRLETPVVNLGVSGAGPLQELALIREYASELRPRAVVWTYYEGNDPYDLGLESREEWLRAYLEPGHSQRLSERRSELNWRYRNYLDSLLAADDESMGVRLPRAGLREVLSDALRMRALRALVGIELGLPSADVDLGLLPEALSRAKADVEAWGGRFYLVYLPTYRRYTTLVGDPEPQRSAILRWAQDAEVPVIDLDRVFGATGDPRALWTSPSGHLAERGYELMAESIAATLRAEGLLDRGR